MIELNEKKSKEIYAGGISAGICAAITAGISFIIGIFDGVTRPFRCR